VSTSGEHDGETTGPRISLDANEGFVVALGKCLPALDMTVPFDIVRCATLGHGSLKQHCSRHRPAQRMRDNHDALVLEIGTASET
jgi:hypothetical protein